MQVVCGNGLSRLPAMAAPSLTARPTLDSVDHHGVPGSHITFHDIALSFGFQAKTSLLR